MIPTLFWAIVQVCVVINLQQSLRLRGVGKEKVSSWKGMLADSSTAQTGCQQHSLGEPNQNIIFARMTHMN